MNSWQPKTTEANVQREELVEEDASLTILACCSIGLGTLFAIFNVPDDIGEASALFTAAMLMTIGLLMPVVLQLRFDLNAILRIQNLLTLGVVYWLLLDLLQSAYAFDFVTPDDVRFSFGVIGAFSAGIWLGSSGRGWSLPRRVVVTAGREFTTDTLFRACFIAFVLGMSKFVIASGFDLEAMWIGLGSSRWEAPWGRGDLGGADAILDHMQYFGYILPSLCVLMARQVGWLDRRVLVGLILSIVILAFLSQSGGRRIIGVVVGAGLFTWMAAKPKLELQTIIGSVSIIALLLMFMQLMLQYRGIGFSEFGKSDSPERVYMHLHVDDNFLRLTQLIAIYPQDLDYVWHQPFFHALMLPIPRVLWPGKPLGPGFDLPGQLGMSGVSLSCSIVGELYVSFGIFAVILGGWILGRLCGMWNKILLLPYGTSRPLMYGLGLMALFTGMRSAQALVQMSYIILAWMVIASFIREPRTQSQNF